MNLTEIEKRISIGETLLLDGAIGTQLQRLNVPMDNTAWAAKALVTHPSTVLQMHRMYIDQSVDIITTNTYSSARHNLEPLGLGDQVAELNIRAVHLAMEARDRFAQGPLAVAGSISSFGLTISGESERALHRHARGRTEITERQAIANLNEQAKLLEETGVDFTVHVVGFDVSDPEALAQMQCLADETGGRFLTAANASELGTALSDVVAEPAPERMAALP